MGKKGKLFLTEEFQLINAKEMKKIDNTIRIP